MNIDYRDNSRETLKMTLKNREDYVEHLLRSYDSNDVILAELLERLTNL